MHKEIKCNNCGKIHGIMLMPVNATVLCDCLPEEERRFRVIELEMTRLANRINNL